MRWSRWVLLVLLAVRRLVPRHTFGPQVRDGARNQPVADDDWRELSPWIATRQPTPTSGIASQAATFCIATSPRTRRRWATGSTRWRFSPAGTASSRSGSCRSRSCSLTITLVWWIAGRIGGQVAACLAAGLYILLSTDPFLFGNGANLEHFVNLFAVASLAFLIFAWDRAGRWPLLAAGICLGAAALVKQFAILPVVVFVPALFLRAGQGAPAGGQRIRRRVLDVIAFSLGIGLIAAVAAAVLVAQGAGRDAFDDIFLYGPALATDTLREPGTPTAAIRWLTGNADPEGRLPWPFGTTDWLVWWGTASWPLWLASIPSLAYLLLATHNDRSAKARGSLGDFGVGRGRGAWALLAALLPAADRRCLHRRGRCSGRRRRRTWLVRSGQGRIGAGSAWRVVCLVPHWRSRSARRSTSRCAATCLFHPRS